MIKPRMLNIFGFPRDESGFNLIIWLSCTQFTEYELLMDAYDLRIHIV